jgi:hypothetical protein
VPALELALDRLDLRVRLVWAFHAREVRFERRVPAGGVAPLFPETFSFHLARHDPFELHLQLEDLWSDPRRLGEGVAPREAQALVRRLLAETPAYLDRVLGELERGGRLAGDAAVRVHGDIVVLSRVLAGFLHERGLDTQPDLRLAALHLRRILWRAAWALVGERVAPQAVEAWASAAPSGRAAAPSSRQLLAALAHPPSPESDRLLLELAERACYEWLEEVCLDEANGAFEGEGSPFASREQEVLAVASVDPARRLRRTAHLSPFLRRAGSKDCLRLLRGLEVWFLRQYDVPRAAAVIRHAEDLARARRTPRSILSWHSTPAYLLAIAGLTWPFVGAVFAYDRAPRLFDVACSAQIVAVIAVVIWYLGFRFVWQKDLAFFHGAVPRIGAGIIVGYLPVFLIDEVWDLARRPWFPLGVTVVLLGFLTLLYLYVEVRRRILDPPVAFARARRLFLLGVLQAVGLGLTVTTLLGGFMVSRAWGGEDGASLAELRATTPPFLGELPRIMGVEPVLVFPTAILLMTFLSFFIGTFLQLLWEDLPITEPL